MKKSWKIRAEIRAELRVKKDDNFKPKFNEKITKNLRKYNIREKDLFQWVGSAVCSPY